MTASPTLAAPLEPQDVDRLLPDCVGLVLPSTAGSAIDRLRTRNLAARVERAAATLQVTAGGGSEDVGEDARVCAAETAAALQGMEPLARLAAFDTPDGSWDAPPPSLGLESVADPRSLEQRVAGMVRHLVGMPGHGFTAVLPPVGLGQADLHLPHTGLCLRGPGPVAVLAEPERVVLTWDDGASLTLPTGARLDAEQARRAGQALGGRVRGVPLAGGSLRLEPLTTDRAQAFAAFGLADAEQQATVCRGTLAGLELLHDAWPAAADCAGRWLSGVMPLAPRRGTRSHTSTTLDGVLLTSATDALEAAEIICHEVAHLRLFTLLQHDPLLRNGGETGHPSPWRVDPRPLLGLLHGVHAFVDVCTFHRRVLESGAGTDANEASHARQSANIAAAWQVLERVGDPTDVGTRLLQALHDEVSKV